MKESGLRWLGLSVLIIALDQLTKWLIVGRLELYEKITLLPVLDLQLWYNTGAAFSFLDDASGWQRYFFIALALAVSTAIVVWLRRLNGRTQWLLCGSLALILGGALGNVIDRIRIGHVVDFIRVHWNESAFPAFNVADSAITVGAVMLLLDAWLDTRRTKKANA